MHEGGNANDIQIKYDGADQLTSLENGSINAICQMGKVMEEKPYSYELSSGRAIATNFELKNNVLSFNTENYKGTLVIDPKLIWGTYFGGSNIEYGNSVATDSAGNVYLEGLSSSTSNIATTGAYQTINYGHSIFIVKFNSSGSRQWATYYGAQIFDYAFNGISDDANGNIYITGGTGATSHIATPGAFKSTNAGYEDAFLAKFNSTGSLKWATYFGGNGNDGSNGITCNKFGNVYITGWTSSDSGIASAGAFKDTLSNGFPKYSNSDCFLAKFDTSGNLKWATYYGGKNDDWASSVTCDGNGNVIMYGGSKSDSGIATAGSYRDYYDTGVISSYANALFIVKFDSTGNRTWGTYLNKPNNSNGSCSIVCDSLNNLFITGIANDNLGTTGTFRSTGGGAFLAKFSSSGNRLWGTYYGGGYFIGLAIDKFGTEYISGSTSYIDTTISTSGVYQGGSDAYIARFTSSGQRLWGTYYGGYYDDNAYNIATDQNGDVYMCGSTTSIDNIATTGSYQTSIGGSPGNKNAFLAKFNTDTTVVINQPYTDTVLCKGGSLNIAYTTYMPFNTGNTFTVQLSDTNGNFTSPTTIGTVAATTSGTISCTIPASAYNNSKYRIRIIASLPAYTSPDNAFNIRIISNIASIKAGSNSPICPTDTLKLTANDTTTGIKYIWSGPLSFTSTKQNPVINSTIAGNSGQYIVTGSANSCNQVKDSIKVIVAVPPAPIINSNSPVCYKDSLKLTAIDSLAGVSYHWMTPDSLTTTKQNPVLRNPIGGTYIAWVSLPHCNSLTSSLNVSVSTPSTPSVTISSKIVTISPTVTVEFTAHPVSGGTSPSYQWRKNGVDISGANTNPYTLGGLAYGDLITVVMYSSSPCDSPDYAIGSMWGLEAPSAFAEKGVELWPNPTSGILQIEHAGNCTYTISDITGRILLQGDIKSSSQKLDISNLNTGIYLLQLINASGEKKCFKINKQ